MTTRYPFYPSQGLPDASRVAAGFDPDCKLYYCMHQGKRLYFPGTRANSIRSAKRIYLSFRYEQQLHSPHRHFCESPAVFAKDKVIAEVGAAEGMFSLECVEYARKLYSFEAAEGWGEALQKTFEPYRDKVTNAAKYVSDVTDEHQVRLDDYFANQQVDVIKMDIERAEMLALHGAKALITGSADLKMAITTYHKQEYAREIRALLESYHPEFVFETSEDYMCFFSDPDLAPPYLRRGILRCTYHR